MKKILFLIISLASGFSLFAQQVRPMSSAEIYQKLGQLNVLGTVMYIAAHPDDENTRLLSYLVHHDHVRTIYLSLTRGDGGQNILGDEQGAALGLIRTHELMEARKIDGAEQLFSPVIDFGYTKSPEETFTFWDKESLTQDVVAAIQKYKPDILICRFPTTGEGGHGQHTASAFVAGWAYDYIRKNNETPGAQKLWLPKRLLFNSFRFGRANTIKPGQFKLAINQYDPLLGEGYGEMAGRSRSVHKSQGAGTPQVAGISEEHFALIAGDPMDTSLYDGIDLSWKRAGAPEIGRQTEAIIRNFNFSNPSESLDDLLKVRKKIRALDNSFWRTQKLKEIDKIILSCAGVMTEIVTNQPTAVPGSTVNFSAHIIARAGNIPAVLKGIEFPAKTLSGAEQPLGLQSDSLYKIPFSVKLNPEEPLTQPYWMIAPPVNYRYQYGPSYGGVPEVNPLKAKVHFLISGVEVTEEVPLSYKYLNPLRGDVVQRLLIIPALSVTPVHNLFIFERGAAQTAVLQLNVYQNVGKAVAQVRYKDKIISSTPLDNLREGLDTLVSLNIPTEGLEGTDSLYFEVVADGKTYDKGRHLIQYEHIPELQYFTDAAMKIVAKDWTCAAHKIGYVEGVGDYVDDVLRLAGLTVDMIPEKELNNEQYLKQYDAIILGIRALNTKKYMASGMEHLLRYVADGGTLVVQYNKNRNLVTDKTGPYPFSISGNRVTDEHAKVTFTNPGSPLLQFPNKITTKDFEGWVQERGIYFPSDWDQHYQTLFSMHDAGEKDLKGAVLYTPYGKGQFIYTSLVFFRELPAGNAGAIRLLMNFLSAGKQNP